MIATPEILRDNIKKLEDELQKLQNEQQFVADPTNNIIRQKQLIHEISISNTRLLQFEPQKNSPTNVNGELTSFIEPPFSTKPTSEDVQVAAGRGRTEKFGVPTGLHMLFSEKKSNLESHNKEKSINEPGESSLKMTDESKEELLMLDVDDVQPPTTVDTLSADIISEQRILHDNVYSDSDQNHQNIVPIENKEPIADNVITSKRFRALIVCVTSNERIAIRQAINEKGIELTEEEDQGNFVDYFKWPSGWDITLCRTLHQRGEAAASFVTDRISKTKYDAVFMVGMCMGIKDRIKSSEVLVPNTVFSLAHRRDTKGGLKCILHPHGPPAKSIRRLQSILDSGPEFTFKVEIKQSACGPWKFEDIDSVYLHEMKNHSTDIYGYEMEAEGFFSAVLDRGFDALLVKGVSDFGDAPGGSSGSSQSKKESQLIATKHALDVVLA
jgi:nucleoside phosphorylase